MRELRSLAVLLAVVLTARGQYDPPTPAVSVRVRVPSEVAADADVTYRIIAENVSRAQAHHVLVKATLPKGVTLVKATPKEDGEPPAMSWKLGTLEPGQKREVTVVVRATTDDDLDLVARVQFEHGQRVRTRVNRPGLSVRRTGPTTITENLPAMYRLEVTNTGGATAKGVAIEETLPDGILYLTSKPSTSGEKSPLVWALGDIPAGRTKTIEYEAAAPKAGKYTLRTVLKATGLKDQEKTATLDVLTPNVDVSITGPASRAAGRPARYTITVVNTGTAPLTGVKLVDEMPPEKGIELVPSTGDGKIEADGVSWDLGRLEAGAKRTVTVEFRVAEDMVAKITEPWKFVNSCLVRATGGLIEQKEIVTRFTPRSAVAVEVEHDGAAVAVGKETALTIRVLNTSKEKQTKVPLVVTLPDGLELIEARGPGKNQAVGGTVKFDPIDTLDAGAEVTAVVRVKAVKEGEHKVKAKADVAEDEGAVVVRGK